MPVPRINIAVDEILTDPDDPIELSTLSAAAITDRIQQLHSFLPSIESISIDDGIAMIVIRDDSPYREDEALRNSKTAGRGTPTLGGPRTSARSPGADSRCA